MNVDFRVNIASSDRGLAIENNRMLPYSRFIVPKNAGGLPGRRHNLESYLSGRGVPPGSGIETHWGSTRVSGRNSQPPSAKWLDLAGALSYGAPGRVMGRCAPEPTGARAKLVGAGCDVLGGNSRQI